MSWNDILGHDRIATMFAHSWESGRLGHAYLFTGPDGIGKRTFAKELANTMLCEKRANSFIACGECTGCNLFKNSTHPDFIFATKPVDKNEFPAEKIREIIDQFGLKSLRGGFKVAVLDDIETLNSNSANAFLKTLEEPPVRSLLILLSKADANQLLPTIRSRCQIVPFSTLSHQQIREILRRNDIEDHVVGDRLARLSGGSPGMALELNDPDLWVFRQTLLEVFGTEVFDSLEFGKKLQHFVEEAGKDSAPRRKRISLVLKLFINLLQDAVRIAHQVAPVVADDSLVELLEKFVERVGLDKIDLWTQRAIAADEQNEHYVQIDLILEAFADFLGRT